MFKAIGSQLRTIWTILQHTFTRAETVQYPEQKPYLAPRYRGRIVLTKDPTVRSAAWPATSARWLARWTVLHCSRE